MDSPSFDCFAIDNVSYIEGLYARYLQDKKSIDPSWRYFFEGMQLAAHSIQMVHSKQESKDLRSYLLITAYRTYGHLMANCNPMSIKPPLEPKELNIFKMGFKEEELPAQFPTCGFLDKPYAPLQLLIDALKKTYSANIGIEYMGLDAPEQEIWLQQRIEPYFPLHLSQQEQIWILEQLNKAEFFEAFLHTKYVGQKRFSLEGAETLIPMLSVILEKAAELGVKDATIGMAHRGRLNVLAHILNKSYLEIFREFEAHYAPGEFEGTGDVKYHKGFAGKLRTRLGKEIEVTLVANPSHLEAVDPIVEGIVRAKQELKAEKQRGYLPILIHGDASIAGQGVVYETIQLAKLNGYATGGTLHIVINNQIGFTTLPKDTRSTLYCTQIAKAFGAPVFHVNAEDPQGCIRAAQLAIELRQTFQCDVFLDLNCYRKYGHNESDEPTFTQPLEYALIKTKPSIRQIYREKLIQEKVIEQEQCLERENAFKQSLHQELEKLSLKVEVGALEKQIPPEISASTIQTQVPAEQLISLTQTFCSIPQEINIHPKVAQGVKNRLEMIHAPADEPHIDWGLAEHLAFATLLTEQIHIRLSGQDVRRGTFSHRHAIWVDQIEEKHYFPLSHLSATQAPFAIFNSPLSEYAVLGFDFGYSTTYPRSLVIWEAQFGDFSNGAQIIIDQFIASSEQKWRLSSNLTLLLPHGYEGQGPEHSSARIERFLQLAGQQNMRIANCSTPAQLFHLLRAQALSPIKKPLILFTPKALLRHPACLSPLNDFTKGKFQELIDEQSISPSFAKRLLLCSGKIYYDLLSERQKQKCTDTAIVRIEQLYPIPNQQLKEIFTRYAASKFYWVQEEHSNMGAWEYVRPLLYELLGTKKTIEYIGRGASASPAVGSYALHKKQLEEILQSAFGS